MGGGEGRRNIRGIPPSTAKAVQERPVKDGAESRLQCVYLTPRTTNGHLITFPSPLPIDSMTSRSVSAVSLPPAQEFSFCHGCRTKWNGTFWNLRTDKLCWKSSFNAKSARLSTIMLETRQRIRVVKRCKQIDD